MGRYERILSVQMNEREIIEAVERSIGQVADQFQGYGAFNFRNESDIQFA